MNRFPLAMCSFESLSPRLILRFSKCPHSLFFTLLGVFVANPAI